MNQIDIIVRVIIIIARNESIKRLVTSLHYADQANRYDGCHFEYLKKPLNELGSETYVALTLYGFTLCRKTLATTLRIAIMITLITYVASVNKAYVVIM